MFWSSQPSATSIRGLTTVNVSRGFQSKTIKNQERRKKAAAQKNDLVLLDDIPAYRLNWLWSFALIAIVLCIILLGLLQS
jgi:hypothetical protein